MIDYKDIIGWAVAIVVAIIGVSKMVIHSKRISKQEDNNTNQSVKGDNNIVTGGDANITIYERR